jgi:hypothetical protein
MGRQWQAIIGGLGIAVIGWNLFMNYGFATMLPPTLSPADRKQAILDRLFLEWPMSLAMSVVFVLLTGCAFLCVRGIREEDTVAGRIGGLVCSVGIAAVVMLLPLLPILMGS